MSGDSALILVAFGFYLVAVAVLGVLAHRFMTKGSFVKGYFLGNRGLGPWVLALTVAATAISGGSFMGFPSLIYSNGWVMGLWICSYMVVPLTAMVWLGKRINQAARVSGAVTVPDVLRDRFNSPALGVISSLLILFLLCFNLVGQFKGGGLVLKEAMHLRPPAAELLPTRARDTDEHVVLVFTSSNGEDVQKVARPQKNAKLAGIKDDAENRRVEVTFQVDGKLTEAKKVSYPPAMVPVPWVPGGVEKGYLIGLLIFVFTVVAYTTYGGFWAVTWTDVFEGLVMLVGVLVMSILAVNAVEPINGMTGLAAATERLRQQDPRLVYGPGPASYLPLGMAISFFLMWSVSSAGQPSGMVRLMSFKDTPSLRRAMVLVAVYYFLVYVSLLIIFVCARAIFPTQYLGEIGTEGQPDSIMPAMARHLAHPLAAGLLMAAPYAAIMSTVAAFLLMISSSLVRDLYQRTINPKASQKTLKRLSYFTTALVGLLVLLAAVNPPPYLQYVIIFTGSGQSCTFFFPMLLGLFWKRATRQGILAGVLAGFFTVLLLYVFGWIDGGTRDALKEADPPALAEWLRANLRWLPGWGQKRHNSFAPLVIAGLDPIFWGFLTSLVLTVGISLRTKPDEELVKKYFP
jgi:Na+/proline symporter